MPDHRKHPLGWKGSSPVNNRGSQLFGDVQRVHARKMLQRLIEAAKDHPYQCGERWRLFRNTNVCKNWGPSRMLRLGWERTAKWKMVTRGAYPPQNGLAVGRNTNGMPSSNTAQSYPKKYMKCQMQCWKHLELMRLDFEFTWICWHCLFCNVFGKNDTNSTDRIIRRATHPLMSQHYVMYFEIYIYVDIWLHTSKSMSLLVYEGTYVYRDIIVYIYIHINRYRYIHIHTYAGTCIDDACYH